MTKFDESSVVSGTDAPGHVYVEHPMGNGERIRYTWLPNPRWYPGPTIRIQKRGEDGHLFEGVEIPADHFTMMVAGLTKLVLIAQEPQPREKPHTMAG